MSIVAKKGHTLFDLHPNLKSEWDYEKNSIVPDSLHPGTVKKVFWKCKEGHSFEKTIRSRTELKTSCPECNSFEFNFPECAKAWHTKNLKRANEVSKASGQKVFWVLSDKLEHP